MNKYFGDKKFYKMVLTLMLPILIQNGITNFVNLLDNIMVGRVGTEEMSGVAIANQLIFVYNLLIFGGVSGASIYGSQFFGAKNIKSLRETFRFALVICITVFLIALPIMLIFGEDLISLFLHESNSSGNIQLTLSFGLKYIRIAVIGLLPFAISQAYACILRSSRQTFVPMVAAAVSVIVNLVFNYILIFGKFGAPELGVEGAAIATVIARFVDTGIIVIWTKLHSDKCEFIKGAFSKFYIPKSIALKISKMGLPLLINEGMWSLGMTTISQCYSIRGLDTVAAYNISSVVFNLFSIAFISCGGAISIIVGNLLGAGKTEEAIRSDRWLIVFSFLLSLGISMLLVMLSPLIPEMYNTTHEVKELAKWFIIITAIYLPLQSLTHTAYFTLRTGGKTAVTILFDSVFTWAMYVPTAFLLSRFTTLDPPMLIAMSQIPEALKCIIGMVLVAKGNWARNIVIQ